ncbi:HAD-IA family hydrolase [Streptomyces sp. NPDC004237]|uniref:HAD family hydrolase n=1 Tax=Streptomyces sp. NPDC004237 TaxID=3154455 RepID=UPI0033BC54F8
MALLLLDLDNTLVDRDAAFRAAVADFLAEHGLPDSDLTWAMDIDAGGYTARDQGAAALADRVVLAQSARETLTKAQADGWTCVIVTNGRTVQQQARIRKTGLDRLVQGWVISEAVGHKKPEPEIFQAAADAVGVPFPGAWVIGDSPHADIAGANTLGLQSVWVTDGRTWIHDSCRPTRVAGDVASAINQATTTPG